MRGFGAHPTATPPRRVVIVGGGVAAQRCAMSLRERGYDGSLTVISEEKAPPYDRPLLSKEFLSGLIDDGGLELVPTARYADRGIDLLLGSPVVQVRPADRVVVRADGLEIGFDRLVIATGATARLPQEMAGTQVHVLRSLADAWTLRDALARCSNLTVIGGGVLGCEIAATAATLGIEVTVLAAGNSLMESALGAEVGERLTALHRERGVVVRTNVVATGVDTSSAGRRLVRLEDGATLATDAVVVAVGMVPTTSLMRTSERHPEGPRTGGAIRTHGAGRTAVPDIFAAGDCASWLDPQLGTTVRAEHWEIAAEHGVAVAGAVLGEEVSFDPLPYFWSTQYDTRLQWVGHRRDWDSVSLEPGEGTKFIARYENRGRLVAVLASGTPAAIKHARQELSELRKESA